MMARVVRFRVLVAVFLLVCLPVMGAGKEADLTVMFGKGKPYKPVAVPDQARAHVRCGVSASEAELLEPPSPGVAVMAFDLYLAVQAQKNRAVKAVLKAVSKAKELPMPVAVAWIGSGVQVVCEPTTDAAEVATCLKQVLSEQAMGLEQSLAFGEETANQPYFGERWIDFRHRLYRDAVYWQDTRAKAKRLALAFDELLLRFGGAQGPRLFLPFTAGLPRADWAPSYRSYDFLRETPNVKATGMFDDTALLASSLGWVVFPVDVQGMMRTDEFEARYGQKDRMIQRESSSKWREADRKQNLRKLAESGGELVLGPSTLARRLVPLLEAGASARLLRFRCDTARRAEVEVDTGTKKIKAFHPRVVSLLDAEELSRWRTLSEASWARAAGGKARLAGGFVEVGARLPLVKPGTARLTVWVDCGGKREWKTAMVELKPLSENPAVVVGRARFESGEGCTLVAAGLGEPVGPNFVVLEVAR